MSKKIRILILEDEFITLDNLRETLQDLGYTVSGAVMTAEKAITILDSGETDFAILDIQLKGDLSGIWVAEQIKEKYKIPFLFLTAFSDKDTLQSAAHTFPLGYLIKPFNSAEIYASIEVALKNFQNLQENRHLLKQSTDKESIFIKKDLQFIKINIADILLVQVFKNYLELQLSDNRQHLIRSTLKQFKDQLPDKQFLQPHRSFLVNKQHIEKIGPQAVWINSQEIPISRRLKEEFLQQIDFDMLY